MILRCTRKALDLLREQADALADPPPSNDDWYLNLLWLDRQKCLLLTHAGTLFPVFVAGVRKTDLRTIGPYVVNLIEEELHTESLPFNTFDNLDPDGVRLAKTASRSVLGFMNDTAFHCRYEVASAGGLARCDISAFNHRLRRTLHKRGEYVRPIDLVAQRLA